MMDDMNAKVSNDNTSYKRAMGKEGCGSMNNNGERLLECYISYKLDVGGTLFGHPNIHNLPDVPLTAEIITR